MLSSGYDTAVAPVSSRQLWTPAQGQVTHSPVCYKQNKTEKWKGRRTGGAHALFTCMTLQGIHKRHSFSFLFVLFLFFR